MKKSIVLIFAGILSASPVMAGFDGGNAPGGQQVGGHPNASQDGGVGYQEGKSVVTQADTVLDLSTETIISPAPVVSGGGSDKMKNVAIGLGIFAVGAAILNSASGGDNFQSTDSGIEYQVKF